MWFSKIVNAKISNYNFTNVIDLQTDVNIRQFSHHKIFITDRKLEIPTSTFSIIFNENYDPKFWKKRVDICSQYEICVKKYTCAQK